MVDRRHGRAGPIALVTLPELVRAGFVDRPRHQVGLLLLWVAAWLGVQAVLWAPGVKNRLRELRAARSWSQVELGARVGVSRQAIIAIEAEKYHPSLPLAFKLARVFGLAIEDVFEFDRE